MKQLRAIVAGLAAGLLLAVSLAAPAQAASPVSYSFETRAGYFNHWYGYTEYRQTGSKPNFNPPAVLLAPAKTRVALSYDYWTFNTGKLPTPKFVLQKHTAGKKWSTVEGATFTVSKRKGSGNYTVTTNVPKVSTSKSTTIWYRVLSKKVHTKSKWIANTDASPSAKITYQNQNAYSGIAAQARDAIKSYCPQAVVKIRSAGDSRELGRYEFGGFRFLLDPSVTAQQVKTVAIHECAHFKQYWNWKSGPKGYDAMEKLTSRLFANDAAPGSGAANGVDPSLFDPIEHAADCAAASVYADYVPAYSGWCSPSELAHGRALMGGKKY